MNIVLNSLIKNNEDNCLQIIVHVCTGKCRVHVIIGHKTIAFQIGSHVPQWDVDVYDDETVHGHVDVCACYHEHDDAATMK